MAAIIPIDDTSVDSLGSSRQHVQQLELRRNYDLMHKHLFKSMNAYAVVLSILLIISYSGLLQPPHALSDNRNPSSPSKFQTLFLYFNGISFFSSVAGLLLFASCTLTPLLALDSTGLGNAEKEAQKRLNFIADLLPKFAYVIFFLGLSLTSCVLAYVFAGLATVRGTIRKELPVIITSCIGGLICLQALWILGYDSCQLIHGV